MPAHLPVIVGFGGVNPAGRLSFHHAYRRMVIDALGDAAASRTFTSLAALMGTPGGPNADQTRQMILDGTLIRRITDERRCAP
jgi:acetoacetyl-[acyl-carrier protein] synthase